MFTNIRKCDNLKDGIQNKETVKIRFPLGHLTRTVGQAPLVPTVTPPVVLCSVVARVCGGLAHHAPHCLTRWWRRGVASTPSFSLLSQLDCQSEFCDVESLSLEGLS